MFLFNHYYGIPPCINSCKRKNLNKCCSLHKTCLNKYFKELTLFSICKVHVRCWILAKTLFRSRSPVPIIVYFIGVMRIFSEILSKRLWPFLKRTNVHIFLLVLASFQRYLLFKMWTKNTSLEPFTNNYFLNVLKYFIHISISTF